MPKTVHIRDIDDRVYAALQHRAAAAGISVPELLRREATRLAARPSMDEWLDRLSRGPAMDLSGDDVDHILDEWRGPWPEIDR